MDQVRLMMGKCLLIGVSISFLLLFFGGIAYLLQHYADVVNYQNFTKNYSPWSLSSRGIILAGLYVLLFTQLFRVVLTVWYFYKEKSPLFVAISVGIFLVLIATMVGNLF